MAGKFREVDAAKDSAFKNLIDKKYGEGSFETLARQPKIRRVSTGSFELDVNIGGGIVLSRINMIWGKRSGGKSTMCFRTMAEAQKLDRNTGLWLGEPGTHGRISNTPLEPTYYDPKGKMVDEDDAVEEISVVDPDDSGSIIKSYQLKAKHTMTPYQAPMRCLFVNQEGVVDKLWAHAVGVDVHNTKIHNSVTAEETIDVVDAVIRDGLYDLIVVDSLAAMTPKKETEESLEKWQQGLSARLTNKALRIWVASMNSYRSASMRPTIILVNQERTNIGQTYGDNSLKPGGKGQDFAPALEIRVSKGAVVKDQDLAPDEQGGHKLYTRTNYSVTKNKTYPEGAHGQYMFAVAPTPLYDPGDMVQFSQILEYAKAYGVLYKEKTKWKLGDRTFPTQKAIRAWAEKEPFEWRVFEATLKESIIKARSGIDQDAFEVHNGEA